MTNNLTYAIDFGTSNSLLAAANNGNTVDPIALDSNSADETILRSLMYFPKNGENKFGNAAIAAYTEECGEGRFIRSIKKFLPSPSFTGTQINNKSYTCEDLIGCFLREMKNRADLHFNSDVSQIVLGRPAKFSVNPEFDKLAESRLKSAAELAGFKDIEFFPEPLAAAYHYRKELTSEKIVLVVDLGGGTSDFTVIKVHPTNYSSDDVLSIGGISVAGDILDGCIMRHKIAPHFGSEVQYQFPMSNNVLSMPSSLKGHLSSPADITMLSRSEIMSFFNEVKKCVINPNDLNRMDQLFYLIAGNLGFPIFEKIEQCKRSICEQGEHRFIFDDDDIYIDEPISYKEFLTFSKEKIDSIFETLDDVISQAQINCSNIDLICCTGGTSKIPAIKDGLSERFAIEKIQSFKNFHSVIQGLADRALEIYN